MHLVASCFWNSIWLDFEKTYHSTNNTRNSALHVEHKFSLHPEDTFRKSVRVYFKMVYDVPVLYLLFQSYQVFVPSRANNEPENKNKSISPLNLLQ